MGEWREYRIGDIATLVKNSWKVGEEQLPYLGLEHIDEAKLRLNGIGNSDDVASNKYRFSSGDVLFGKLRPYFRKVVKPKFNGICSTDIWVLNATNKSDIDFIFYFFSNQELIDLSYSSSSGTRMPRADWKFLSQTLWDIPPLKEQKAIAEVLSSLDDKIDLLHRQNKTLEALAQTLFRQWFIEEAKGEWEMLELGNFVLTIDNRGKTPPNQKEETPYPVIEVNALGKSDRLVDYSVIRKYVDKETFDTWFRNTPSKYDTLVSTVGSIGAFSMFILEKGNIAQNVIALHPENISAFYLYQILNYKKDEIMQLDIGGVQPSIKVPHLLSIVIPSPDKDTQDKFDNQVIKFVDKMEVNYNQIKTLENMRDTLLPKLMSGEVRVKL